MVKSVLDWIAFVLVIIGGLSLGLFLFDFNLVTVIFRIPVLIDIVYGLVGVAAIYMIFYLFKK